MKKTLFCYYLLLFSGFIASAQYWQIPNPHANSNPGNLNNDSEFPVGGGLEPTWSIILAPSTSLVWSASQTLPFSFSFNGKSVTSFKVSNSGIVTFDVTTALPQPSFIRAALPNASIPDNSICIWGIAGIGTNDNVVKKVFGTAPNRQYWIQFNSFGYGGTPSDGSNFCYWSIVLEESSNRIHIVDQRSRGFTESALVTAGVQVDSSTAFSVADSPNYAPLGYYATSDDNSFYTFVPGTQPSFDLSVTEITTNHYLSQGKYIITGVIKNLGTTTINSFVLNYKINGGAAVSSTINGVNVGSLSTYSFSHPTKWNATIGSHIIEVYATNLNGINVDANTQNDSHTKVVSVMSEYVVRFPLFEIFTSSTCGPCAPGNANYHSIVEPQPQAEYVGIKYQQDFPGTGDPYTTSESVNRRFSYYSINSIPRMMIDGGWNYNATAFTKALYDEAISKPAQYKLNGEWSINDNTVNVKVRFSPLFNATGAKVKVAILEGETFQNEKTNGETKFKSVMKKMLPNEEGTALPKVAIGSWDSLLISYTFNGNYRLPVNGLSTNRIKLATEHSVEEFTDLHIIAWVQGIDKTVYQAANLSKVALKTTNTTNKSGQNLQGINVYPNPSTELINVSIDLINTDKVEATLVDLEGRIVARKVTRLHAGNNAIQFNVSNLANGVYNVIIFDDKKNSFIHKIIVQH